MTAPRMISATILPFFLIGQLTCFCAAMRAATTSREDHNCCAKSSHNQDHSQGVPRDEEHNCDHCRGVGAIVVAKGTGTSQALKPIVWGRISPMTHLVRSLVPPIHQKAWFPVVA